MYLIYSLIKKNILLQIIINGHHYYMKINGHHNVIESLMIIIMSVMHWGTSYFNDDQDHAQTCSCTPWLTIITPGHGQP